MVKGGKGKGGWKGEARSDGKTFENNACSGIKGPGGKMKDKLNDARILQMIYLKFRCFDNERSKNMVRKIQWLSKKKMADCKAVFENTNLSQGFDIIRLPIYCKPI